MVLPAALALTLSPAHAHHSYAAFDRCKAVVLEGEITNVDWVNPHIRILLRTADVGDYFVEWFSLIQMERVGIAPDSLKAGDQVVVSGNAMRDPSKKVLSLLTEIRRPSDGWNWTSARQQPDNCAPHRRRELTTTPRAARARRGMGVAPLLDLHRGVVQWRFVAAPVRCRSPSCS